MTPDVPLSTDLSRDDAIAWFTWDDPMTVGEVRAWLRSASPPERRVMLAKILRETRDIDVWRFVTPVEVERELPQLAHMLGRKQRFWEWLIGEWRRQGLLRDT